MQDFPTDRLKPFWFSISAQIDIHNSYNQIYNIHILASFNYWCNVSCSVPSFYSVLHSLYVLHCTRTAHLVVHRFSCCTAVSSMVRVDCCHAMAGKRMRKMRAVTRSHWACSVCLGEWNLFVLSTCTPVVCSCQIRLSNQETSGRPRL